MKKILLTTICILFCSSILYADDRYKPWVYNETKISEKCLKNLYPLASGDWYEEYYKQYFGKDLSFGDIEFEYFIGLEIYLECLAQVSPTNCIIYILIDREKWV